MTSEPTKHTPGHSSCLSTTRHTVPARIIWTPTSIPCIVAASKHVAHARTMSARLQADSADGSRKSSRITEIDDTEMPCWRATACKRSVITSASNTLLGMSSYPTTRADEPSSKAAAQSVLPAPQPRSTNSKSRLRSNDTAERTTEKK